jgi:hypothetical protein
MSEYFVHYTVLRQETTAEGFAKINDPQGPVPSSITRLKAGPYNIDEALTAKRDLEASAGIVNVYIEEAEHEQATEHTP